MTNPETTSQNAVLRFPDVTDGSIQKIMTRFDFNRVHRVMEVLNWKWEDSPSIPTLEDLKNCAIYCLENALQLWNEKGRPENGMVVSTGGFEARIHVFTSGFAKMELSFQVEHSWS